MYNDINYLTIQQIKEIGNSYLIGYIKDKYSIKAANDINVRFEVDLLCEDLKPFVGDKESYIAFDFHNYKNKPFKYGDYKSLTIDNKVAFAREHLYKKIIIFRPRINYDKNDVRFKNVEIIDIIDYSGDEPLEELRFIPIPYYQSETKRFEDKLKASEELFLPDFNELYLRNYKNFPEYIMTPEYIYLTKNTQSRYLGYRSYKIEKDAQNILKYDYVKLDVDKKYEINKNLFYFNEKYLRNLVSNGWESIIVAKKPQKEKKSANINEPTHSKELVAINQNKVKIKQLGKLTYFDENETTSECLKKLAYFDENEVVSTNSDEQEYIEEIENENDFINNFMLKTLKNGLFYNKEDLVNFHTCVKSNLLTVIAGMSGTGKTKLALEYASMFDITENDKTLLFMPISPSYTEPSDILGYLNNLNGLYIPSDTGFVDLLIEAEKNPEKLYMVVFDEMNLAQIEHWFAPILSIMEITKIDDRNLTLYSSKANCINNERYGSKINIGANIRFIGTVNLDETTKRFSDRFLDRTNIISLSKRSFKDMVKDICDTEDLQPKSYTFIDYQNWTSDSENLLKNLNVKDADTINLLNLLDSIHNEIIKCDTDKGVSFRMAVALFNFINNIPSDKNGNLLIDKRTAIDMQIKQRLITKLRGSEKQYKQLLGYISGLEKDIGSLEELLISNEGKKISDFKLTLDLINKKAKELGEYGYAD